MSSSAPPAPPAPPAHADAPKSLSNHELFLVLLHDPTGRGALYRFMQAGYSEHHLTFWEQVELHFKHSTQEQQRNDMAKELYARFVKNGSAQQINITEPQRLKLQTAIEAIGTTGDDGPARSAPLDLFDDAAATCLELIKGNYYFPFQQSKEYEQLQKDKKQKEQTEQKEKQKNENKSSACTIL